MCNLCTAGWLATASWLSRSFATAAWLFFCTASWLAAVVAAVLSHHASEKTFDAASASCTVAAVNFFCTASWLFYGSFAATSGLFFSTASWLAAVAAVLSHHTSEKTLEAAAASCSVAAVDFFCTANRLNRSFAATSWLSFCTTNWLACIASISFTKTEKTKRTCVGGARGDQSDCQQSWNDYTTHREFSMEKSSGRLLQRLSRNTSERPKTSFKPRLVTDP